VNNDNSGKFIKHTWNSHRLAFSHWLCGTHVEKVFRSFKLIRDSIKILGNVSEMLLDELDDRPGRISTELNNTFRTLPGNFCPVVNSPDWTEVTRGGEIASPQPQI